MNSNYSKLFLEKNMESFGSYKNRNSIENFGAYFAKGKCPGGKDKEECIYTYETIKDKENTTTCNSSCEKIHTYRQFKRQNNDPKKCIYIKMIKKSAYDDCQKMKDKDIEWKT